MAIVMTHSAKGSANMYGSETRMYEAGEQLVTDAPWQQALADNFIAAGLARDTKTVQPTETKEVATEAADSGVTATIKKAVTPNRGKATKSSE
jgi:hypothetical protein